MNSGAMPAISRNNMTRDDVVAHCELAVCHTRHDTRRHHSIERRHTPGYTVAGIHHATGHRRHGEGYAAGEHRRLFIVVGEKTLMKERGYWREYNIMPRLMARHCRH